MDLDISMRSSACPYTVQFYGALFREGDVWICMEVMDMSLDKFYTKVYKHGHAIPEDILGKVAFAVYNSLNRFDNNVLILLMLNSCANISLPPFFFLIFFFLNLTKLSSSLFNFNFFYNERLTSSCLYLQVVSALHYLYSQLRVIHRDVKPSNILINRKGEVKICDFGISGYLVDSVAKTIDAGCKPYMAVRY